MAKQNQETNNGKISLDRKILVSIINLAAKEINGVESVTNTNRSWIKKLFKKYDDGVEIKFEQNGASEINQHIKQKGNCGSRIHRQGREFVEQVACKRREYSQKHYRQTIKQLPEELISDIFIYKPDIDKIRKPRIYHQTYQQSLHFKEYQAQYDTGYADKTLDKR